MVNNRDRPVLFRLLGDPSVFKIVLCRRNVLANHSSRQIAAHTGQWGRRGQTSGEPPPKIRFDAAQFVKFHNAYMRFYRDVLTEMNRVNSRYYIVNYEEINDPYLFAGLLTGIRVGSESVRLPSEHQKQNSSDILARYSNADEVEQFLTENGLIHWSYEGATSLQPLGADDADGDSQADSSSDIDPGFEEDSAFQE